MIGLPLRVCQGPTLSEVIAATCLHHLFVACQWNYATLCHICPGQKRIAIDNSDNSATILSRTNLCSDADAGKTMLGFCPGQNCVETQFTLPPQYRPGHIHEWTPFARVSGTDIVRGHR